MSITINLDIKESYNKYIDSISVRSNNTIDLLIETRNKAMYIANQLFHVGESFNLRNDLYQKVKLYRETEELPPLNYLEEVNFKNLQSEDWFISKNKIVTTYFKSFVSLLISIYNLEYFDKLYSKLLIDYQSYYRILNTYYNSVANKLLEGMEYDIYGVGILRVVQKRNTISKGTKFKVDWGESFNLLKEYAKNHYPQIYNKYISKDLNKNAFIEALSTYFYDETENPNGFKWLVHLHKDTSVWLTFYHKRINPNYNVVPSNFVMNETRSQVDFTNNIKSIDEIFESNQLGFRDKLNCLVRYNPDYINNFIKV